MQEGKLPPFNLAPQQKLILTIPFLLEILVNSDDVKKSPGAEFFLKITSELIFNTHWARPGYILAWDQFNLPFLSSPIPKMDLNQLEPIRFRDLQNPSGLNLIFVEGTIPTGEPFQYIFNQITGQWISYKIANKEYFKGIPQINFWRAPTDNDMRGNLPFLFGTFDPQYQQENRKVISINITQESLSLVQINIVFRLPNGNNDPGTNDDADYSQYHLTYQILGTGDIVVHTRFDSKSPMPRFGMQFTLLKDYSQMSWFGRGPHETYQDRQNSGAIDQYNGTVKDQFYSYIVPQENANKTDVRWVSFLNNDRMGLLFVGNPLLSVSAWPYSQKRLILAKHTNEIQEPDDLITVNIDHKQMGIGGWHCGSLPRKEYLLNPGTYEYKFLIRPYKPEFGPLKKHGRIAF